jgi:hypothetical protein
MLVKIVAAALQHGRSGLIRRPNSGLTTLFPRNLEFILIVEQLPLARTTLLAELG